MAAEVAAEVAEVVAEVAAEVANVDRTVSSEVASPEVAAQAWQAQAADIPAEVAPKSTQLWQPRPAVAAERPA